jgi:hypothetical protein
MLVQGLLVWEGLLQVAENNDRWAAYASARATANALQKPLLNIGCPRQYPFKYPCGDVCLDISEWRLSACQAKQPTLGDVRRIPFPDGYFGAALCCHVLEHLATAQDAQQAYKELHRVTNGKVFLALPTKLSMAAWVHPEHKLWVQRLPDGSLQIEER